VEPALMPRARTSESSLTINDGLDTIGHVRGTATGFAATNAAGKRLGVFKTVPEAAKAVAMAHAAAKGAAQ
jgi:hypothetical protein